MSSGACTTRNNAGSVLLMVLILVIIAGLVMSTMAAVLKQQNTDRYRVVTTARLTAIQQALNNFVLKNNRLPCPTPYTPPNSSSNTSYGAEETSCTGAGENIGAVPIRSLGLPEEDRADELNNQFTYAVDDKATTPPATILTAFIYNNFPTGAIKVTGTGNVWYVLIAHGKDGSGAYTRSGVLAAPCGSPANGQDYLNCGTSTTSFSNAPYSEKKGASHFDDYILFSSTTYFAANCASIGKVPTKQIPTSLPTLPLCQYISSSYGGYYMIYDSIVTTAGPSTNPVTTTTSTTDPVTGVITTIKTDSGGGIVSTTVFTPTGCRMPNFFPGSPPTGPMSQPVSGCSCPAGYTAEEIQDSYIPNCTLLNGMLMGPGTPPAAGCAESGYVCNKN